MTRDRDTVDAELRLLSVVRATARALGGKPTNAAADQLLDERLTTEGPAVPESTLDPTRPTTDY